MLELTGKKTSNCGNLRSFKINVFSPCYAYVGGERYDNTNVKYFLNHPDLKWIPTNGTEAPGVPGAIPAGKQGSLNMYIGRKIITIGNGTFTQIGKIWGGSLRYYIPGNVHETLIDKNFDVLACSPCYNGGTGPCKRISNLLNS